MIEPVQPVTHVLRIRLDRPQVVTEGEEFAFTYTITNAGNTVFPGGYVNVLLKWPIIDEKVLQPLIIDALLTVGQDRTFNRTQAPMTSGYTVFYINEGVSNDHNPVQVINTNGGILWPPQNNMTLLFDAVRARTHEEITSTDIRETLRQNVEEMRILNKYSKRLDYLTILLLITTAWLFFLESTAIFIETRDLLSMESVFLYIFFIMGLSTLLIVIVLLFFERRSTKSH